MRFQELPHIPVLGQALQEGDVLEVAQRAVLITFLIQEINRRDKDIMCK